jgi:catechol 2,3-dioxygenase-like lactoylglutathione lyase family enzyme
MTMTPPSGFDHVALAVPDLGEQVERFTSMMGMSVQSRSERYALLVDPVSGFKIELSPSPDGDTHFRHLGFRAADVDADHAALLAAGMTSSEAPHRRDFARMYTAFLKDASGLEIQLVKYDQA